MTARAFFEANQQEGRAPLGGPRDYWLVMVSNRVLLVRDYAWPVLRMLGETEEIEPHFSGGFQPAGGMVAED